MKLIATHISILFIAISSGLHAEDVFSRQGYVETYKDYAIESMKTHQIPASITLAQGILELSLIHI